MSAPSEQEEFEFRLRAEQEAKLPSPPDSAGSGQLPIPQGQPIGDERLPGFADAADFVKGLPQGVANTAGGIANAVQHPIDAVTGLVKKIPDALGAAGNAVMHLPTTVGKVGDYLKNLKPGEAGQQVGSMLAGGAAGKAAGVFGDVVGPSVKALQKPVAPTVRDLANKGVVTTPGMRAGKAGSALEQRLSSNPYVGEGIKRAREKTTTQWNRADINDAIKDAGGKPLPDSRQGRDAIFHAKKELGAAYDRVLSKMVGDLNSADASGITFRQFLDRTKQMATKGLEPGSARTINEIIDDQVIAKFTGAGRGSGETIKEIQETLRTEADLHRRGNYQDRKVAQALDQVRADMSAMLKRENPKLAPQLESIDRGYAKFQDIAKASRYSKKNAGVYTPAQKLRAIEARDKSKNKTKFATGEAPGQKATESVESVIGNTEPDSGTAGRLRAVESLIGAAGGVPGKLLYSQPVLKYLQNRALKKGGPYTPIGKSAPIAGALAAPGLDQNGVSQ